MEKYIVKVLESNFITHDVKRFVVEKPPGYTFIPGQGTEVSVHLPEWKDQFRPFTFTGLNKWDHLEFMIKIYPQYKSVTDMLGKTNAGHELIIGDVFGAIQYNHPGVFIAGGAGITPFMAIFRDLFDKNQLQGNKLLNSNKTIQDVMMGEELQNMLKENFVNIFTREQVIGFVSRRIDRNFLIENIADFGQDFYVCGPEMFVKDIQSLLLGLGVQPASLIIEK
jgi:ferredoxin-NADP reductase